MRSPAAAVRRASSPAAWLVAAAVVYWATAAVQHKTSTPPTAYFDHLADSFRHGRLYLSRPPVTHDLTLHDGRWYVPFYPLPAVILVPWVVVFGLAHTNTVVFAALVGGVNAMLANLVLRAATRRGLAELTPWAVRWLTVAFAFGSVNWYMAAQGSVWFVSQLTATAALLCSTLAALHRRPLLTGVALAAAMLARPHLVLALPTLGALVLVDARSSPSGPAGAPFAVEPRAWVRPALAMVAPVVLGVALIASYNAARFGSPSDSGYLTQNVDRSLARNLHTYGQFNVHFIGHNLWAAIAAGPAWNAKTNRSEPNPDGMSIVLTSPIVALAAKARRGREVSWLWVGVASLALPLVTYYNTGWYQFGYRFALDLWPLLLVLIAIGARERWRWSWCALVIVGVAVNWWGAAWFS